MINYWETEHDKEIKSEPSLINDTDCFEAYLELLQKRYPDVYANLFEN